MKVTYKKGGPSAAEADLGVFPLYGTVEVRAVTAAEMTRLAMAMAGDVPGLGVPDLGALQEENLVLVIDMRAGQVAHLLAGEILPNLPALGTATGETPEGLRTTLGQVRELGRIADVSSQGQQASGHLLLLVCKAQDNFIARLEAAVQAEAKRLPADAPERGHFLSQARPFLNELEQSRQKKKDQAAAVKKDKAAGEAKVADQQRQTRMVQAMQAVRSGGPVNPDDLAAAWDHYFPGR